MTSVYVLVSNLSQVDQYIDLTMSFFFFCRQLCYRGYERCKFTGHFMGFLLKSVCTIVAPEAKAKVLKPFAMGEFFDEIQIFSDVDIALYVENGSQSRASVAITPESGAIL